MVCSVSQSIGAGNMEESAVERLIRHTEVAFLRGRVSNILVALDLYTTKHNVERAKAYAARSLTTLNKGRDVVLLKRLLISSERTRLPADFDEKMPNVVAILRDMEAGSGLNEQMVSSVKSFLMSIEEGLTLVSQREGGPYFEPWRFQH
jgi:hypothetical protein